MQMVSIAKEGSEVTMNTPELQAKLNPVDADHGIHMVLVPESEKKVGFSDTFS